MAVKKTESKILNQKHVLVTGGTGNMGSGLVKRLADEGYLVTVLALQCDFKPENNNVPNVNFILGDITKKETLKNICKKIDIVFHLAAVILSNDESVFDNVNIAGTINLLDEARRSKVKHFVYVSSASVVYPKVTPYSLSKRVAEREVRTSGVPWTIIRPTLVYGVKGGMEFDMFLNYLKNFPIIPFIGNGDALKRPVFVDDLIDGFIKLAKIDNGTQKVYNFSGDSSISMIDFARFCLYLMGEEKKFVHIPVWVCTLISLVMKKFMKKPLLTWNMIA